MKMNYIVSQIIIPLTNGNAEIFAPQRILINLRNEGAGNYLAVEGINDESDGESTNEMYFENEQQIDDFAAICKKILKETNERRT